MALLAASRLALPDDADDADVIARALEAVATVAVREYGTDH